MSHSIQTTFRNNLHNHETPDSYCIDSVKILSFDQTLAAPPRLNEFLNVKLLKPDLQPQTDAAKTHWP